MNLLGVIALASLLLGGCATSGGRSCVNAAPRDVSDEGGGLEIGAEPDLAAWQSFAASLSELAARLNYQQPWPMARLRVDETPTYLPGSATLYVGFSAAVDPASLAGAFTFDAPISAATVAVDPVDPSLVRIVLSGTGTANPGPQGLSVSGVLALGGATFPLTPDPTLLSWTLPPPFTLVGVPTYDSGTTTLTVAFSEAVDPATLSGAFGFDAPIAAATVTVDPVDPSLVHLVLSGTGTATPGTQALYVSGVLALSGAVLDPDPTIASWMLP